MPGARRSKPFGTAWSEHGSHEPEHRGAVSHGDRRHDSGKIEGAEEDGLHVFRGAPFAAPPVGELRLKAPQPHPGWEGVRDATAFGSVSLQIQNVALDELLGGEPQPQSEDCLFLNTWTPGLDDARRPTLVWIHGGGFTIGSGSEAYYEGAKLATRGDVVVVTINYRLGALGFLHLAGLGETNFAMRDQAFALQSVRDNIASFGGDPDNVTIFGESAGGRSVATLMGSAEADGLFHRAIPQSGAASRVVSRAEAEANGARFLEHLGVAADDIETLRSISAEAIIEAQRRMEHAMFAAMGDGELSDQSFGPVIDGEFLTDVPLTTIADGQPAAIPALIGTLDEEWKLFSLMAPSDPPNEEDVVQRHSAMGLDGRRAYDVYRRARLSRSEPADPPDIFEAAAGDCLFGIPAVRLADTHSAQQPGTYMYLFDWKSPALNGALGACHALDIPFVFGTYEAAADFAGSGPAADALAETVMDAWLAFARSGDPSSARSAFPAYDSDTRPQLVFGENVRVEHHWRAEERAVWKGVV